MVGRTPEFLGKKIEKPEIILVSLALLIHPLVILAPTGWSVVAPYGLSAMANAGAARRTASRITPQANPRGL